jgi:Peptide N-acetyl-beta-D-glucosaminyl asparaginase amidase A
VTIPRLTKFAATIAALLTAISTLAAAQTIGSTNTATADPPVPHPNTKPCVVTLYQGFIFNDFNPRTFAYTPPADCPGTWAKVILKANFSISAGIQYDRTANIWIGPTNIYFGTTAEDQPHVARNWHIERDLTDYSSILTTDQVGTVDLGNLVNSTYTGVIHGSAEMLFYPVAPKQAAPRVADQIIAFSAGPTGGTVGLTNSASLLEQTLTLPTNITNAYLDVFAQSQSNDEFWYTCVPNDVAGELYSCSNTAFRESEITIDGTPAGVAPVYPWIYTGGIDPFLWVPIPGVQTLNFKPYRVNLTPFAALLDDGNPHTIALSVFNANSYFSATASLLLYMDSESAQLTGGVTENTLTAPLPTIKENIEVASNGNLHGTVSTRSAHKFQISGYVNTARGPVTTTVAQDINFSNLQTFKILAAIYEQDINQDTTIHSVVTTENAGGKFTSTVNHDWPLKMDITQTYNDDGSGVQTTSVNQYDERDQEARHNGQPTSFSLLKNRVTTTDALDFNSSYEITGNQNQSSAQNYFAADSKGYCYSRDLTAAANILTSIANGRGCN